MKIYHTIPEHKELFKNPVVTIGNFDGVHLGHKKIIDKLQQIAHDINGDAVVITFSSHPRKVLNPEYDLHLLTSSEEKVNAIFNYGIDNIILLNFTAEMANMTAQDFFNNILLQKIDVKEFVIGYDHAFGKDRKGNYDFLKSISERYAINITQVEPVLVDDTAISSSWIRDEIMAGNFDLVTKLIGRHFLLSGKVVHGQNRGKKLGFPTANIRPVSADKLIPPDGVYAVRVRCNEQEQRYGMLNIGTNPTFHQKKRSIEVNILDFKENLYDLNISVEFVKRIRDEKTFNNSDELVKQMEMDEVAVRSLFDL